jgi:DNA-binding HxlR family transcriptional regulator
MLKQRYACSKADGSSSFSSISLVAKLCLFFDLEREISSITQQMLGQQLKSMEADGIVHRTAYPQDPPKVEYRLTKWGQSLCPALDAILKWADRRPNS